MHQCTNGVKCTTNSVLDLTDLTSRVAANEASITTLNTLVTDLTTRVATNEGSIATNLASITTLNTRMTATDDAFAFLCKGVDAFYNLAQDCCHVVGTNTVNCLPRVQGTPLIDDGGGAGTCAATC